MKYLIKGVSTEVINASSFSEAIYLNGEIYFELFGYNQHSTSTEELSICEEDLPPRARELWKQFKVTLLDWVGKEGGVIDENLTK